MAKSTASLKPTVPLPKPPTPPNPQNGPPKIWAYWPQPAPGPSKWRGLRFFLLGWFLVVPATLAIVLAVLLFALYRSQAIMPGVQVMGQPVGGQSTGQAAALLQQQWAGQEVVLQAHAVTWPVKPETLGISLDTAATVAQAHRQGRSVATLVNFVRAGGQVEIEPVWHFNPALAEKNLQTLAPEFEVPAVDAGVRIMNGRAQAVPASRGYRLDVAATMARLAQRPEQIIETGRLALVLTPVEPAIADASEAVEQANRLLATPINIRAYDPVTGESVLWTAGAETLEQWLSVAVNPGAPAQLDWALNAEQVRSFLTERVAALGSDRYLDLDVAIATLREASARQNGSVRLRVYHHPRQHTVRPGETLSSIGYNYGIPYPWIEQANPGLGNGLSPGQVITIPSPDELLPLPVVENKRIVVSLSEQKMWAYEDGALKWEWPVSTGIASSPTAPGVFQIQTHEPNAYAANWNLWMPNFMGIYRPVPTSDFMNGFHGFPTRSGSNLLWTDDLGHPVTYGCILVSSENATTLYNWAEAGVVVEIQK